MSMIQKMSILGIRSFGVRDDEIQFIEFQHPLTLLVGPNGAGKTTVIESLKYITTGDQPSNCKGGAFVHDPKLVDEVEVKAKVALKYRNMEGDKCTIVRCLKATQGAKTVTVKTLDGFISKIRDGVKTEITSKCSNLNLEMESALGVPKAIMENVIFCHQEEANWPLSDGGTVKKKFDEIFSATRYNKASDEIKKLRKQQDEKRKEAGIKLEFLKRNKEEASEKRDNLEKLELKLSNAVDNERDLTTKLAPIKEKIRLLEKQRCKVLETDQQLKQQNEKKNQLVEFKDKLRKGIGTNLFHGTDEKLAEMKRNHSSSTNQKEQEKRKVENNINTSERRIEQLSKNKTNLIQQQSKLQQLKDSMNTASEELRSHITSYSDEFGMSPQTLGMNDDSAIQAFNDISNYNKNIAVEHVKLKKSLDESVSQIQSEVDEVWKQKMALEKGIEYKQGTMKETKTKYEETKSEIDRLKMVSDSNRIDILKKQLIAAEKDLSDLENNSMIEIMRQELKRCEAEKRIKEQSVKNLDEQIEEIQKFAKQRSKIEHLKNDLTAREEVVRKLKSKYSEPLKKIKLIKHGTSKQQNYPTKRDLQKWLAQKENEIKTTEKKIKNKREEYTKQSTRRDIATREIKDKENRKNAIDDETFDLCGSQQFDEELQEVQITVNKLQEGKGVTDGIQYMYKKYLNKLKPASQDSQEVSCPLCHRLFTKKQDIDELAEELEQNLQLAPQNLQEKEQELTRMQIKLNQLLQHKPKKEEFDDLNTTVIPTLRKSQHELSDNVSRLKSELEELENTMVSLKDEEATGRPCLGDLTQIDTNIKEITEITKEISKVESKIPSMDSQLTYEEVNLQKKSEQSELQELSSNIELKRDNIDKQSESLQKMRESVNELRTEKHELDSDLQRMEQLKESRSQLEKEYKKIKLDVQQSMKEKQPIENKLNHLKKSKLDAETARTDKLRESDSTMERSRSAVQTMSHYRNNIQSYKQSGSQSKLDQTTRQLSKLETEILEKENELSTLRENSKRLEKEVATFEKRQRDISDNIELRKQEREIVKVDLRIKELAVDLEGTDTNRLEREMKELNQDFSTKTRELERYKTKKDEYSDQIKIQKKELEKSDYKHADENYRDANIAFHLAKRASMDLAKYQISLDHAIMRYHTLKMDDINHIIKEIWRDTYQGRDIEYIEITSDAEGGTSTKRSHNYRVVKVFEGRRVDMRGRCSAGQKVLASLVIRLALAETFCISCGILALDEPTTNLDREHIHALAEALDKIIEARSKQRNFQLLVITHDEDFVEYLGRSRHTSHYFRVDKSSEGSSTIRKCLISELAD